MVHKIAKSLFIRGYDYEDLVQIGFESIIKCINKFDIESSNSFSSYVYNGIRQNYYYMIRTRVKDLDLISLDFKSEHEDELINRIKAQTDIEYELCRKEALYELYKAVETLNQKEKDIILYLLKDSKATVKAYSEKTAIGYTTCIKRRNKAFEKLRSKLSEALSEYTIYLYSDQTKTSKSNQTQSVKTK
jgi:RNA polymerase sigma factor (sigma-70 family)